MLSTVLFWPRGAFLAKPVSNHSEGMKIHPRKHRRWSRNSRYLALLPQTLLKTLTH